LLERPDQQNMTDAFDCPELAARLAHSGVEAIAFTSVPHGRIQPNSTDNERRGGRSRSLSHKSTGFGVL
ncbi:hypothetical protein PFISCL1PPCAC_21654, partial [Pristionchus fissidentatus]